MDAVEIFIYGVVACVFAAVLVGFFLRGEEVGRIAFDGDQVKPSSGGAKIVVKRGRPSPPDGRTIQVQVRIPMGINAWELCPAEAEELAGAVEDALRATRA